MSHQLIDLIDAAIFLSPMLIAGLLFARSAVRFAR